MKVHGWGGGKPTGKTNKKGRPILQQRRSPLVDELERKHNRRLGNCGTIYIGEKGTMYTSTYGSGAGILEKELNEAFKKIAVYGVPVK